MGSERKEREEEEEPTMAIMERKRTQFWGDSFGHEIGFSVSSSLAATHAFVFRVHWAIPYGEMDVARRNVEIGI